MSWMKTRVQQEVERNKEVYKNRRGAYVTEKTIEYVVDEIKSALTPNMAEDITEYGSSRIELNTIELYRNPYLYKSTKDALLYYRGRMGDYGLSDVLVIDRRCDFDDLLKALSIEFDSWRVNITNNLED